MNSTSSTFAVLTILLASASAHFSGSLTITLYTDTRCNTLPSNGTVTLPPGCSTLNGPAFQSTKIDGPFRAGSYSFYADDNCTMSVGTGGNVMNVACQSAGGELQPKSAFFTDLEA